MASIGTSSQKGPGYLSSHENSVQRSIDMRENAVEKVTIPGYWYLSADASLDTSATLTLEPLQRTFIPYLFDQGPNLLQHLIMIAVQPFLILLCQ